MRIAKEFKNVKSGALILKYYTYDNFCLRRLCNFAK